MEYFFLWRNYFVIVQRLKLLHGVCKGVAPTSLELRADFRALLRAHRKKHLAFSFSATKSRRCRANVAPVSRRRRAGVASTSGRCRVDVAPVSRRRRAGVAPTSRRCRADIAPVSRRRRTGAAPTSRRCRAGIAPTSGRCRADVAPTSRRCRAGVAPTSRRHRAGAAPTSLELRADFRALLRAHRKKHRHFLSRPPYGLDGAMLMCRATLSDGREVEDSITLRVQGIRREV